MQESDIKVGRKYRDTRREVEAIVQAINDDFVVIDVINLATGNTILTSYSYNISSFIGYFIPLTNKIKATALAKKIYPDAEQEGDFLIVEL